MGKPVVVVGWQVGGRTGWGLFGLHLGLQMARLGYPVALGSEPDIGSIPVGLRHVVRGWFGTGPEAGEGAPVVVSALNAAFEGPPEVNVDKAGVAARHVGIAVFEDTGTYDDAARGRLAAYAKVVVPSAWCGARLLDGAVEFVPTVVHQGYDGALWRPRERRRSDGRFVVFAGGKLEFRKGQDIVVEAFRRFRRTPEGKDALLVTQWHNAWPQTMDGVWAKGWVEGVPEFGQPDGLTEWLALNGIPKDAHTDLGFVGQAESAAIIAECDVAVFASRGEGATNMALAECMALGVPCIASWNTGHKDLPKNALLALEHQPPVETPCRLYAGMAGWGESDPEEMVEQLKAVRNGTAPETVPLQRAWRDVAGDWERVLCS